jgi:hypothetical protein
LPYGYTQEGPAAPGLPACGKDLCDGGRLVAMHDFGFQLSFEGLDLTEHSQTSRRAAHLPFKQMEDFVQALGRGPESRVLLSGGSIQVHVGSSGFLDIMIVFARDASQ